jgi:hypothetical protein
MLTSFCQPRRGAESLDKFSKTRENRRTHGKYEPRDTLTSILIS